MRRVVTLPPGLATDVQQTFAERARREGADLLELRSDLHRRGSVDAAALARAVPLIVADRGPPLPVEWLSIASELDRPLGGEVCTLRSFHAERPLTTREALAAWETAVRREAVKHVEPLGDPASAPRLFETQRALAARFGNERVTVLTSGSSALPFRCALAEHNALDYLALDGIWSAAPGQRLLRDAMRGARARPGLPRRGILGSGIAHSRSPRVHRQPFDRIDLPAEVALTSLLEALHSHYEGLAVTSPFKLAAARAIGSSLPAVNTLVRRARGWEGANTDVEGALALLERFGTGPLTVLGDGGAAVALRCAAAAAGRELRVLRRTAAAVALSGEVVWTWPSAVEPPAGLCFRAARVAVVAYGSPARAIEATVRRLGGEPVPLGPCWFIAQARGQRRLWDGLA